MVIRLTPTQRAALEFFGERSWRFASDFSCSRSVLYRLRDAGLIVMRPHHRETSVGITDLGRTVSDRLRALVGVGELSESAS